MRASSRYDIRHSLVVGYVWDLPFGSSLTGVAGALLKGWSFSGIATLRSGSPLFVDQDGDTLNTDPAGITSSSSYNEIRPDLVPGQNPILPGSERTVQRWFNTAAFTRATVTYGNSPRNPVVGPGDKALDIAIGKSFQVREGQRLEFRLEAFNSTNTPQFNNPNTTMGNANFGRITGAGTQREAQLALKYVF
jgi:hypothetical protein